MDDYRAGITVNTVSIEDAAPPREVADAFDEVQRAEQDEDRFKQEAQQYSNQKLGQARGEAAQIREAANAYKQKVVNEAKGQSQRFLSIFNAYRQAPEVTRRRMFLDTMEQVLQGSNKVIIDQKGNGQNVVPYLPLPEVQSQQECGQGRQQMTYRLPICHRQSRIVLIVLYNAFFIVNAREQAIVVRFGEIQAVETKPGLYFKLPFGFVDADASSSSTTGRAASTSTTSGSRFRAASSTRSMPSSSTR